MKANIADHVLLVPDHLVHDCRSDCNFLLLLVPVHVHVLSHDPCPREQMLPEKRVGMGSHCGSRWPLRQSPHALCIGMTGGYVTGIDSGSLCDVV